eukprot:TRINITY_DN1820_c0_g1_i2.p1 TRINITY_DN1820_c0_g1~~TRINITY_DN1820_c0_g1_i2.p1  ORF type:complete len:668 (-),score=225.36 TRINITY_DN1820_c0_g1_i2:59-2062(-)
MSKNMSIFLLKGNHFDESAYQLTKILDDGNFASQYGKTKYDVWMQLCDLISDNPETITKINVEKVIRAGIQKFTNEVGKLWISLANYYIGLSYYDKARDVFEESMGKVITVRDFSLIWEAYSDFEEKMMSLLIEKEDDEDEEDEGKEDKEEEDEDEELQFQLQTARYEELLIRRPLLLNSVKLRQNPNNVQEWHKRVSLYTEMGAYLDVVDTYKNALKTVDPMQSSSKVSTLWINYSRFYEDNDQIENARKIFQQATKAKFQKLDDLASVWSQYVEMEIRNKNYTQALKIIKESTNPPPRWRQLPKGAPITDKLYRSTKLWAIYADLTECFGTFEEAKEVYEKMIEVKVITPAFLLNYCLFLEEKKHFEDSFKAFQKGVELFKFPYSMDIWITYLTKFVERYQGKEIERTRELFEQAIEEIPPSDSKTFFIMYADFEEKFGLARHAMYVYDKATKNVQVDDRYMMYLLYISRATEFFGITRTRSIFEQAISSLPDKYVKDLCLKYATLEKKLGEIDRARAIYSHASQFCDPNIDSQFWEEFHNFEVAHGNEETFRNMLRIKRSIQAQYNSQFNFRLIKESQELAKQKMDAQKNPMQLLENKMEGNSGVKDLKNPEEIDINLDDDDDDEDGDDNETGVRVEQMEVPKTVFESLSSNQGAKERLKKVPN